MDPKEFSWTEDQQVTVTNPTAETYKFKVHSKEYELGPGRTAKMPGYIAWVYVYGLASKLCQADDKFSRWNEEGFRQEYYDKLVSGTEPVVQNIQIEEKSLVETLDNPDEEEGIEEPTDPPVGTIAPMKAKATSGKSTSRA